MTKGITLTSGLMNNLTYIIEQVEGNGKICFGCRKKLYESNAYRVVRIYTFQNYYEDMRFCPSNTFFCEPCKEQAQPVLESCSILDKRNKEEG